MSQIKYVGTGITVQLPSLEKIKIILKNLFETKITKTNIGIIPITHFVSVY